VYLNNVLISTTSTTGAQPSSSNSGIVLMRRWDSAQYWGGKLGIVRIYSGDIGSTFITQNWNANRARFGL
jgi:hypothetical protein